MREKLQTLPLTQLRELAKACLLYTSLRQTGVTGWNSAAATGIFIQSPMKRQTSTAVQPGWAIGAHRSR